jgi:adenylate kinase
LRIFHRQIAPVVEHYHRTGRLIIIDGWGSIEQVNQILTETMEALTRREALRATRKETSEIQALKEVALALSPEQVTETSLDIVLLGAPGTGKGTQSQQICQQLHLTHIATGDLFRENLKNQTELGKLAKTFMDRGELVPDDVTEAMVRERLARPDTRHGFVLDGFPRTLSQAEALTDILNSLNRRLDGVFYFKVPDEELVTRLSGRLICRECQVPFHKIHNPFQSCPYGKCQGQYLYQRDDDKEETIRTRLKTFHRQTAPLIDYYREAGLLIEIDGQGELWEVTARVLTAAQHLMETI